MGLFLLVILAIIIYYAGGVAAYGTDALDREQGEMLQRMFIGIFAICCIIVLVFF